MKIELTQEQLKNLIILIGRTNLQGDAEVTAYLDLKRILIESYNDNTKSEEQVIIKKENGNNTKSNTKSNSN